MKKAFAILLTMLLVLSAGCAQTNDSPPSSSQQAQSPAGQATGQPSEKAPDPPEKKEEMVVLRMATAVSEGLKALNAISESYTKDHPNVTMEVTVLPGGVAGFNSAMASKLAADDAPDLFQYQWGTQIIAYAKGGHLMDLTDTGVREVIKDIPRPVNRYKGRDYAYPLVQQPWGLLYNTAVGEKMGLTEIPKTSEEFIGIMETMRQNGVEYPFIVPAKDGSGATGFVFCYVPQIIMKQNPDFYYQCLTGEKSWNGPEWRGLLELYGRFLEYSSPDRLGLDPDNGLSRLARGEGAFMVSSTAAINRVEEMNPDLVNKVLYIPFPLYENAADYETVADYDSGLSIWSKTKNPQEAVGMYKQFFTPQNSMALAESVTAISPVKGTPSTYLKEAVVNQVPLLEEGKFVGLGGREWIPGIKEIMKKVVQEWMGGVDIETSLANLEMEHQRLLEASPEFIADYEALREG